MIAAPEAISLELFLETKFDKQTGKQKKKDKSCQKIIIIPVKARQVGSRKGADQIDVIKCRQTKITIKS